jgi:sulfatase modifying factor 1
MVWIPAGQFVMGSDRHFPEEAPTVSVALRGFWIDRCPVTNDMFARFVDATGHVTVAERAPDPDAYPDADAGVLVPSSAVFAPPAHRIPLTDAYRWWSSVPGADWRHPRGPGSGLDGLGDHPVVHVGWSDVEAYTAWAGKSLPTEAEWEYAARGGRDGAEFAWGDELTPGGRHLANVWQGDFPVVNDTEDGYYWTSPVGAFPANDYGLVDMIGNVWELTADWWSHRREARQAPSCCAPPTPLPDPTGGPRALSVDTEEPITQRIPRKVIKGGSYLCSANYCSRYRPAARLAQPIDTSTCHIGFRCVVRV